MYPQGPVRDWPAEQQRRLALEAIALFEPILESLGFDSTTAKAKAQPYLDNLDNRLREISQYPLRFPSRTAFIARYAREDLARRYFDSLAPGAYYWTWIGNMLDYHWKKDYRLLIDPKGRRLELEAKGKQAFQAALDLPPHAFRAIADAFRPGILTGLSERKEEIHDSAGTGYVGQECRRSLGDDKWSAVELSYRLYDKPKPFDVKKDEGSSRLDREIEDERQRIEQLGENAGCISWEDDWQTAFARAKAENKIVMVDFTGKWCGWCRKLDEITFRDPTVAQLSSETVNVKVDDQRDRELHSKHRVRGIPDVRFYSPDEELLDKVGGFKLPEPFAQAQRRALSGVSHFSDCRDRFRDTGDPLAAADLLAFSKFIPPEQELAALSAICTAIRNGDKDVLARYEHGTDALFAQRARALFELRDWGDALAAAEADAEVMKEETSRAHLAVLGAGCLYVLGRREEAEEYSKQIAKQYGGQYSVFDAWFLLECNITDWP